MVFDNDRKALIMLSALQSYNARKKLYESVPKPSLLYDDYSLADDIIEKCQKRNIGIITILDEDYPKSLKNIYDPPFVLYYQGNKNLLQRKYRLAVVGTRKVTTYGKNILLNFVPAFVKNNILIISGLARGVDSMAHRLCLENNGETIAVVANGLDICYPPENLSLEQNIIERGLVLSEYPVGAKSLQYHFPERNRIISALSQGVFIPEAGEKSGSLITADYAIEHGRELYIVPGNIFSPQSKGCNNKIKELQATMVLSPDDVLDAMGVFTKHNPRLDFQLDLSQQAVIQALENGSAHLYDIMDKTGMSMAELPMVLTQLEVMGLVRKIQGNFYEIVPSI